MRFFRLVKRGDFDHTQRVGKIERETRRKKIESKAKSSTWMGIQRIGNKMISRSVLLPLVKTSWVDQEKSWYPKHSFQRLEEGANIGYYFLRIVRNVVRIAHHHLGQETVSAVISQTRWVACALTPITFYSTYQTFQNLKGVKTQREKLEACAKVLMKCGKGGSALAEAVLKVPHSLPFGVICFTATSASLFSLMRSCSKGWALYQRIDALATKEHLLGKTDRDLEAMEAGLAIVERNCEPLMEPYVDEKTTAFMKKKMTHIKTKLRGNFVTRFLRKLFRRAPAALGEAQQTITSFRQFLKTKYRLSCLQVLITVVNLLAISILLFPWLVPTAYLLMAGTAVLSIAKILYTRHMVNNFFTSMK